MKSKYKKITIALAGLFVLSSTYGQTAPGTGRITFNGELTANTCSINGGDVDQTVQLPKVSTSSQVPAMSVAPGWTTVASITRRAQRRLASCRP